MSEGAPWILTGRIVFKLNTLVSKSGGAKNFLMHKDNYFSALKKFFGHIVERIPRHAENLSTYITHKLQGSDVPYRN